MGAGIVTRQLVELYSRAATAQGGVFSGDNPATYSASDPIKLWIIQLIIIIGMTQLLSLFLSRMRQPKVIAEVIGGVLLGPTVMGRIPGFKATIFPDESMDGLTLTANIGLVLFLFLVGLEIDVRMVKRNVAAATAVSVAGLLVPLGMGAAVGVGIYNEFTDGTINYGYFLLFTAVAIGITAFPVLCRILTELKLLDTTVGVVVLSAGVGNDVIGWVLLALTVALVNADSGLTALWVLLTAVGFVIFLLYPVKWGYVWLAKRTGSLEAGSPTAFMMTITLLTVYISAFFTDIIGVHAIFGGFLAGLIIPHENGYAISLVEKLEDFVSLLLLPLYFTLSGLKTNLGLLNNGITWAYVVILCLVAFASKFFACAGAALALGFNWREAGAMGSLMSCKGLVELIVLNVGLQAGVLDQRTFSMFVLMALVLTFMTTPLTLMFYPERHRKHTTGLASGTHGNKDVEDGPSQIAEDTKTRFAFVLEKVDELPTVMTLSHLLQPESPWMTGPPTGLEDTKSDLSFVAPALPKHAASARNRRPITIDALRLIELSNRTSAVIKSTEGDSLILNDPVVSVFRTYAHLNKIAASAALTVVPYDEFPNAIAAHAQERGAQMILLPWARGTAAAPIGETPSAFGAGNPFDSASSADQTSSVVHSETIRRVFATAQVDVALFVDRGLSLQGALAGGVHLFLPFFGGPDDRLALSFLVQLCANSTVTATVVRVQKGEPLTPTSTVELPKAGANALMTMAAADTVYGLANTETRLRSDTADHLLWETYAGGSTTKHTPDVAAALARITFDSQTLARPLHSVLDLAASQGKAGLGEGKAVIVVAGRSRRMAVDSHQAELQELVAEKGSGIASSVPKTLGEVGAALVAAGTGANLLILQAAN
ncbi:Sodium/hydrogen exchanger family-domain-containing protein, partial [Schizophyllum amplum]